MVTNDSWRRIRLGDVAAIARGGSPRPIQEYLTSSPDGINWIKIGDVKPGEKYITGTQERIIEEGRSRSRDVHAGDLILSNSMSYGRPYILKIDGCIHDGWLVIQRYERDFEQEYLFYALSSFDTFNQYRAMSAGSGVQNLSKDKVANVVIYAPNRNEQAAIARSLDDADCLIRSLEELVIKTRGVREGVAQALLSGTVRLPRYGDPWSRVELQDALAFCTATVPIDSIVQTEYVGTENMIKDRGGIAYYDKRLAYEKVREYQPRDILVSNIRPYLRKIWFANRRGGCSNDVLVFRSVDESMFDSSFLFHVLSRSEFFSYATNNSTGTKMPRGDKEAIRRYLFLAPSNVDEQRAIAQTLTTIDEEIAVLERKLEKYKQIRQGMMRELLTGRIRLVQE